MFIPDFYFKLEFIQLCFLIIISGYNTIILFIPFKNIYCSDTIDITYPHSTMRTYFLYHKLLADYYYFFF